MINVLFAAMPERWAEYREPLTRALAEAGVEARIATDIAPGETDYIVYAPNCAAAGLPPLHPRQGRAEPLGGGRGRRRQPHALRCRWPGWSTTG